VIVQASDGELTNLQAIVVTVTNGSEGPLIGDYNNNGTVDLTDYVLWRNGGPLQNEGTTPGVVTSEDYGVWRANFGRTGGAGSGELGAGSIGQGAGSATLHGINAAGPHPLDISRPLPKGEVAERRGVHRPARRGALVEDSSRDDALVAWLASRAVEPPRQSLTVGIADALERFVFGQYAEPSIAKLGLAFAIN
jgi:hypothetical protein